MSDVYEIELRRATVRVAAVFKTMVGDHAGADLAEDDLVRRWAESAMPFLNVVLASPPTTDRDGVITLLRRAADYMRSRSKPGVTFICADYLGEDAETAAAVSSAGFQKGPLWLEMIGEAGAITATAKDHPALRFVRIVDEAGVRVLADINSEAYGFALEAGRDGILGSCDLWIAAYSFIALQNNEPVAVCSYLVDGGVLYLAWVATRPSQQRKGYASAVVSHALQQAYLATGLEPTDLHATELGAPVYQKLGYQRGVAFRMLTLKL